MNDITRRSLLRTAALTPAALVLARCGGGTNNQVPQFVAAIQAVGQEVVLAMPQLQAAGLSGANATAAQKIITQIGQAASSISATSTDVQGQTTLIQIEGYINALAPLVLPFAAAIPYVGLAVAALPAIELAVNLAVSLLSPQASQLAAAAPRPASAVTGRLGAIVPLSPDQALALLLEREAGRALPR